MMMMIIMIISNDLLLHMLHNIRPLGVDIACAQGPGCSALRATQLVPVLATSGSLGLLLASLAAATLLLGAAAWCCCRRRHRGRKRQPKNICYRVCKNIWAGRYEAVAAGWLARSSAPGEGWAGDPASDIPAPLFPKHVQVRIVEL